MSTFNQAETYPVPRPLLWLPICALATLYAMFTLGWMVYRVHLPAQMTQLGFSEQAAPTLLLVEALLTVGIEPLAGAISDRTNRRQNTRWPLIFWGVVLSSLLFVVFSTQVTFVAASPVIGWAIVLLLLSWAMAMSLFRSPALALLRCYSSPEKLPQAASLLTLAFGLSAAATPLASPLVLNLGLTLSFTLAAILILLSALWLRSNLPVESMPTSSAAPQPVRLGQLARSFGLGLTAMLAFRLALGIFPKLLKAQVPGIHPPLVMGLLLVTLGLAALPIGKLALRQGNSRLMLIGAAVTALFLGLMSLVQTALTAAGVAVGLGIGFSLILNGTLPFVLTQVPADRAGLGIGLFFAGVAAASVISDLLNKLNLLSAPTAAGLGTVALVGLAALVGVRETLSIKA